MCSFPYSDLFDEAGCLINRTCHRYNSHLMMGLLFVQGQPNVLIQFDLGNALQAQLHHQPVLVAVPPVQTALESFVPPDCLQNPLVAVQD
jgi:hypothetical protein